MQKLRFAVELLLLLAGATALSTEAPGRRWFAILGLLSMLSLPWLWRERRHLLTPADSLPLTAMLAWPACLFLLVRLHSGPDLMAENSWLFIVATLIVLLLRWVRPDPAVVMAALAIAAGAAGGFALLQVMLGHMPRASGRWHFIVFGNLSMLLGVLPLFALNAPWMRRGYKVLMVTGALGGLTASYLSGSRGGWIALPLILFVAACTRWVPMWRSHRRLLLSGLAAGALGLLVVAPAMFSRFAEAQQDLRGYGQGQVESSLGMRFVMWQVAVDMLPLAPLAGHGQAGFHERLDELIKQGKIIPRLAEFRHAHNEFLDALVSGGLLKLTALLLLFGMPLVYFLRQYRNAGEFQVFALAGALTIGCLMIFGLSEVMFSHTVTNRVYPLLLAVCIGMLPARAAGARHV